MPRLNKQFTLEVSVEQFLENCSVTELHEVELLINSPRFQNKMKWEDPETPTKEYWLRLNETLDENIK